MITPDYIALQVPSSWRAVPFVTESYQIKTGREIALHRYAFKDVPWPEDMSKALQVYSFQGFVGGNDAWMEDFIALKAACEDEKGVGTLVHPYLGSLQAACVGCVFSASMLEGRLHRVQLEFIICESDVRRKSGLAAKISTPEAVNECVKDFEDALGADFVSDAGSALDQGLAAAESLRAEAQGYVQAAQALARDATGSFNAVSGLGKIIGLNLGRYGNGPTGALSRGIGSISRTLSGPARVEQGVTRALDAAANARDKVESAGSALLARLGGV